MTGSNLRIVADEVESEEMDVGVLLAKHYGSRQLVTMRTASCKCLQLAVRIVTKEVQRRHG
jgi:hypothetical protein